VEALVGWRFCQTARHGTGVSLLAVHRSTVLLALDRGPSKLTHAGWARVDASVFVKGTGVDLNHLYARRVPPGTYVVNHGDETTTTPLFWKPEDALILSR